MMPIVWFYTALVVVSWGVLAYLEARRRARKIVDGCPTLMVISRARLNSLELMEPELKLIELYDSDAAIASQEGRISGAIPANVSHLESLLASLSPGNIIVFTQAEGASINWPEVDSILYRLRLKQAYVLDTGLRSWRPRVQPTPAVVNHPPHTRL